MLKNVLDAGWSLAWRHRGRILYYGGVALVLAALALAAEGYRQGDENALVMPGTQIVSALQQRKASPEILRPEGMTLQRRFSAAPEWNGLLRQWESHEAVDYWMQDVGVRCLEAGTVRTVGESGVYGGFVEIECDDRLYRYASLQPDVEIHAGMHLEAGELIGEADDCMPGEAGQGRHLHLEVYDAGAAVDFESLYGKNDVLRIDG